MNTFMHIVLLATLVLAPLFAAVDCKGMRTRRAAGDGPKKDPVPDKYDLEVYAKGIANVRNSKIATDLYEQLLEVEDELDEELFDEAEDCLEDAIHLEESILDLPPKATPGSFKEFIQDYTQLLQIGLRCFSIYDEIVDYLSDKDSSQGQVKAGNDTITVS